MRYGRSQLRRWLKTTQCRSVVGQGSIVSLQVSFGRHNLLLHVHEAGFEWYECNESGHPGLVWNYGRPTGVKSLALLLTLCLPVMLDLAHCQNSTCTTVFAWLRSRNFHGKWEAMSPADNNKILKCLHCFVGSHQIWPLCLNGDHARDLHLKCHVTGNDRNCEILITDKRFWWTGGHCRSIPCPVQTV